MNIAAEIHLEKEKVHPFLAVILRIAQRDKVEVKKTIKKTNWESEMADQPEVEADQRKVSMSARNFEELIFIAARLYTFNRNLQNRNITQMRDMVESTKIMFDRLDAIITETLSENESQVIVLDHN